VVRTAHAAALEERDPIGDNALGNLLDLYFGGDMEASIAMAGQVMGRIEEIKPVRQIIEETMEEFHAIVGRLGELAATMARPSAAPAAR
jgi:enoyl-[acyl-carrier protein] reductase II